MEEIKELIGMTREECGGNEWLNFAVACAAIGFGIGLIIDLIAVAL